MLVLSRKKGQAIEIGNGIVVTITQIKGNQVRLGIEAPPEVPIRRNELISERMGTQGWKTVFDQGTETAAQ